MRKAGRQFAEQLKSQYAGLKLSDVGLFQKIVAYKQIAYVHVLQRKYLRKQDKWIVVRSMPITDKSDKEGRDAFMNLFRYPLDALRDLEIVDTPGTNSIDRMEEEITRGFVPRADLVLFVTSLLQPLTASELAFLAHIREWGKKVIFVVNGVDRRNSDEQLDRVREYLTREVSERLGGPPPAAYMVSALRALRRLILELLT